MSRTLADADGREVMTSDEFQAAADSGLVEAAYQLGVALHALRERFAIYHVRAGETPGYRSAVRVATSAAPAAARTLCDEKPTGRDLTPSSARTLIRDGQVRTKASLDMPGARDHLVTMCPTCREKLGAAVKDLSHLSARDGSATDAQRDYLRRLLDEAFVHHYAHDTGLDRHHLGRVSKREASAAIDRLLAAKKGGWK